MSTNLDRSVGHGYASRPSTYGTFGPASSANGAARRSRSHPPRGQFQGQVGHQSRGPESMSDAPPRARDAESTSAPSDLSRVRGVILAGTYHWSNSAFEELLPRPLVPVAQAPLVS